MNKEIEQILGMWNKLEWRHHGAGLLQAYLSPTERVHIWDYSLELPGMFDSGAKHNHRFALRSLVLAGSIINCELVPTVDPEGRFRLWKIEGASNKPEAKLIPGDYVNVAQRNSTRYSQGESYSILKWDYHWARVVHSAITHVTLLDKSKDEFASLIAPRNKEPVHAIGDKVDESHQIFIMSAYKSLMRRVVM